MLRQQQAEISLLQEYVCQLESGLDSSINLNKAQAERQAKTLTDATRYQWLRNEFANGRETYLAEDIPSGEELDRYIDEQLRKVQND